MSHSRAWQPLRQAAPSPARASPPPLAAPSRLRPSRIGIMAWAADRESAGTRRRVQLVLGVIWLLDAALQYQPYMFIRAFATQVIEPAGAGSPGFVARPVTFTVELMMHDQVAFNALFATVQLAIGLGLLWRRTVRAALADSIIWALSIWWLGEGLGGILTGSASPVTGAPGAAVLYALIAVLAWPSRPQTADGTSVASGSPLGGRQARLAWLALWGSGAYFLLLAPTQAAGALPGRIARGAGGEPGWIASMERSATAVISSHSTITSVVLAEIFAVIALGVFVPAVTRPVLVLAVVTAAAIWVLGQRFGGILTGHATDPNTGPLLILLAAAYWPLAHSSRRPSAHQPVAARGRHRRSRQAGRRPARSPGDVGPDDLALASHDAVADFVGECGHNPQAPPLLGHTVAVGVGWAPRPTAQIGDRQPRSSWLVPDSDGEHAAFLPAGSVEDGVGD
jgi:hypothetical protein